MSIKSGVCGTSFFSYSSFSYYHSLVETDYNRSIINLMDQKKKKGKITEVSIIITQIKFK